jgi:hypothetical protein
MEFVSRQVYQFYSRKTKDIEVDLLRVIINDDEIDKSRTDDQAEAEELDDNKYDGDAC